MKIFDRLNNKLLLEVSEPLYQADLCAKDLSYANLSHADLSDTTLVQTNLSHADLSHANLSRADLRYTNLSHADLSYANLSRAYLHRTRLHNINLLGATVCGKTIPKVELLETKILAALEYNGRLDMNAWHSPRCRTTHCRGGWAVHLAGPAGKHLQKYLGYESAATLIYYASTGYVPNFYASNTEALDDIRMRAEQEKSTANK